MTLLDEQIVRYSRHVLLPDVGGGGQRRLLDAAVAVEVGPGRAAEVCALAYLAAAGVGRLILDGEPEGPVTDGEARAGVLLSAGDVGRPRLSAIAERVRQLNPDVAVMAAAAPATGSGVDRADGARPLAPFPAGPRARAADALYAGAAAAAATLGEVARRRQGDPR